MRLIHPLHYSYVCTKDYWTWYQRKSPTSISEDIDTSVLRTCATQEPTCLVDTKIHKTNTCIQLVVNQRGLFCTHAKQYLHSSLCNKFVKQSDTQLLPNQEELPSNKVLEHSTTSGSIHCMCFEAIFNYISRKRIKYSREPRLSILCKL